MYVHVHVHVHVYVHVYVYELVVFGRNVYNKYIYFTLLTADNMKYVVVVEERWILLLSIVLRHCCCLTCDTVGTGVVVGVDGFIAVGADVAPEDEQAHRGVRSGG